MANSMSSESRVWCYGGRRRLIVDRVKKTRMEVIRIARYILSLGIVIVLTYFILCQTIIYKLMLSMIGPKPVKANYTHTSLRINYNKLITPNKILVINKPNLIVCLKHLFL